MLKLHFAGRIKLKTENVFYFLSQETASSGFFFRECLYLSTYAFTRFATFAELTSPLLLWQTYNRFKEEKKKLLKHFCWCAPVSHQLLIFPTPQASPSQAEQLWKLPTLPKYFRIPIQHSHTVSALFRGAEKALKDGERPRYFCFSHSQPQQLPVVPTRL